VGNENVQIFLGKNPKCWSWKVYEWSILQEGYSPGMYEFTITQDFYQIFHLLAPFSMKNPLNGSEEWEDWTPVPE
jgi:hypothetical protein